MGKRNRFPLTLPLLPGLRWRGKLTVLGPSGPPYPGWYVAWDAEIVDRTVQDRFVFDRTTLTSKQVKDWTGVDLDAGPRRAEDRDV